ncbi:phosphotransferase enzyme family protein [Paenibacillus donghaensis]|uniref:Aminoglycoside phosphotransferase domain-containing protein n=1 Tax=Paenibacillus donghaensis TaxID=414771 RepID=A0A2Z2KTF2_9BACL|nr:phosphotransferase [Paenibacillus donghaensis]ASA24051.1 hypothetical protein B9T62_26670 [Paenibacillus donghaensis]
MIDVLKDARNAALSALLHYDLEWTNIRFIQSSDTITYKIETSSTGSYLLRIHREHLTKPEICSELVWLQALNQHDALKVTEGVLARNGESVVEIGDEQGLRKTRVTLMHWIDGELAEEPLSVDCVQQIGRLTARLHQAAAVFLPLAGFVRPTYDANHFRRQMVQLEQHYPCFLTEKAWTNYRNAAELVLQELGLMTPTPANFGMIHADLHLGNLVFDQDTPYAIDFARCGYGYFLYDMAAVLLGLSPAQRRMHLLGYSQISALDDDYVQRLECFFIMCMIENYAHHAADPRETADLIAEQPYAQAYLSCFLSHRSFLFEHIEPLQED